VTSDAAAAKRPGQVAASALLAAALLGVAPPLRAELWAYVDGHGVAHLASRRIDSRYSQVMEGPASGAAARSGPGNVRVVGKADGPQRLLTWLDIAPEVKRVQHHLREAAAATGVDLELLVAVIAVESGFNASAMSPRGAVGLMQLRLDSADRYGSIAERARPAAERLLDPRINILTGARMLADLNRRLGGIDQALAAWNAGEAMVRRYGSALPPIAETRAHVQLVLELYWALLQRRQAHVATRFEIHD
jgi:soluble lytic murein transglycosylase-like protein